MKYYPDSIRDDYEIQATEGTSWKHAGDGSHTAFKVLQLLLKDSVWDSAVLVDWGWHTEICHLSTLEHQIGKGWLVPA